MYEKPQYMTKYGLRRLSNKGLKGSIKKGSALGYKTKPSSRKNKEHKISLSPEAIKVFAEALKSVMKS